MQEICRSATNEEKEREGEIEKENEQRGRKRRQTKEVINKIREKGRRMMERKRLEKKNEKTKNTNCPSSFAQLTYRFCNIKMDKTSGTFCTHLEQPHHSEVGEGKLFHHSFSFLFFLLAGVYIITLNHPPI